MENEKLFVLITVAVLITAVFVYVSIPQTKCPDCPSCVDNSTTVPTHSASEVKTSVEKYIYIMYDISNPTFSEPILGNDRVWYVNVTFVTLSASGTLQIEVYDSNLSVKKIYSHVPLLSLPDGVYVLNGTLECNESEKIMIYVFEDPYCPACIQYDSAIKSFLDTFNASVDYTFRILKTHSAALEGVYGTENISLTFNYFVCAREQEKITEFKKCVHKKYAEHVEVPLTENELKACAQEVQLNETALSECLLTATQLIYYDQMLAETYFGSLSKIPSTPSIFINCKYYPKSIRLADNALCFAYPNTSNCP